jgi:hypothetical protein
MNSNVRTGDTTYHDVVGVLRPGQTAPVLGVSCTGSGWYVVELNGQQGYISNAAVTLTGSISGLPCFNPPSLSSPLDTDGDGFNDTIDLCPNIPGTDNGCPPSAPSDPDVDGFSGELDQCPDIPGTDNGCPLDSDSDTVPDDEDYCPYDYGSPENYGCPFDSDGDTVIDDQDYCPYDYGSPDNYGCPFDSDSDTVPDDQDLCPYEYGPPADSGCPGVIVN